MPDEYARAVEAVEKHGAGINFPTAEWKILNMADMMVDPNGNEVSVRDRLEGIRKRYGDYSDQYLTSCEICFQLGLVQANPASYMEFAGTKPETKEAETVQASQSEQTIE